MSDIVEKNKLILGIVPLNDSAPLVIAREKGFFEKYGLDVTISKEPSWANIRDKVASGILDGAHMLAGIPIANTIGIGPVKKSFTTAFSLGLNGNAITVSNRLYHQIRKHALGDSALDYAHALKQVIIERRKAGADPLQLAHVYEYSSHNYQLRYWLAAGGIDPERDVRLMVIPPMQMIENLAAGNIDAYCVGEPWNSVAEQEQLGHVMVNAYDIWNNSPEKVFGVTNEWLQKHPNTHRAIIKALLEASGWIADTANRDEATRVMHELGIEGYATASQSTTHKKPLDLYADHFPWRSHAEWFISQMYRWGQISFAIDIERTASLIYRPDLYREAAWELGIPTPSDSRKSEGVHATGWTLAANTQAIEMGPDLFLDGSSFIPARLMDYIRSFGISHLRVDLERLAAFNP